MADGHRRPRLRRQIRHCQKALGKALDDAVRKRLLPFNPARDVEKPRPDQARLKLWVPAQVSGFLRATSEDRLSALWLLLATTGMRRGEVLALQWSDLLLPPIRPGRVTIERSAVVAGYRVVTSTPKTAASVRSIDINAVTTAALRRHRARRPRSAWPPWGPGRATWCSAARTGRPSTPRPPPTGSRKSGTSSGLPVIPLHGLRHSYATAALEAGIPAKLVRERLGHSSIRVTLDTYTHPSDAMARKAAEDVAALLFGGSGGGGGP